VQLFDIKAFAKSEELKKTLLIIWNEPLISLNLQRFSGNLPDKQRKQSQNTQ